MDDLKGKVVLITGSSSGIGAAAAQAFAAHGARVAIHGHLHAAQALQVLGRIVETGGEGAVFNADVADTAQLERLAGEVQRHFGRIDVLVNNAGGFVQRAALMEADDALIDRVFHVNARSVLAMSRNVVPFMRRQGEGGCIINLTSQAARSGGSYGAGLYAASKGYISTLTRALAKELVADRIRVNAVSPGVIETPIHDKHTSAALLEQLRAGIPMQRIGRADECTGALLFLASNKLASYITGQIIEVNGGSVMP
ncbi:MAG: SDR family NAD(P)-dependent oxidoreductase [Burkholderiaceae bacterium]